MITKTIQIRFIFIATFFLMHSFSAMSSEQNLNPSKESSIDSNTFMSTLYDQSETINPWVQSLGASAKKRLSNSLKVSSTDKFECNKIAAICGVFSAITTSLCIKKKHYSLKKLIFSPVVGMGIYKLVATNTEVKESLCDGIDQIKKYLDGNSVENKSE